MRGQNSWGAVVDHSNEISAAVTAIATIFIALYTFALSDSTRALREAAEQQKLDMLESLRIARETAGAAKKSAEAASASVMAFIESERGRLILNEITLIKKDRNDPQPTIAYSFFNAGRGATVLIQGSIDCELIGTESSPDIGFDPTKEYRANNIVVVGTFIGSNTTPVFLPPCVLKRSLTADDHANIAAKNAWILVKGFIRYKTGFNDIYRRNFALRYGEHGDYFSELVIPGYIEEYREPTTN